MSEAQVKCCLAILRDSFSETVEKVAGKMIEINGIGLKQLCNEFRGDLAPEKIRECITTLLQHNLCDIISTKTSASSGKSVGDQEPHYKLNVTNIILRLYTPIYIQYANQLFGPAGHIITREMSRCGCTTITNLSSILLNYSHEAVDLGNMNEKVTITGSIMFEKLILMLRGNFLSRYNSWKCEKRLEAVDVTDQFTTDLRRKMSGVIDGKRAFRPESIFENPSSGGSIGENLSIFVGLNYQRFLVSFVDEMICSQISMKFDAGAASIVRTMLNRFSTIRTLTEKQTPPLTLQEILQNLPPSTKMDQLLLQEYLSVLSDIKQGCYVIKSEGANHCNYSVNIVLILKEITLKQISTEIGEKLGDKACRIFRLLVLKNFVEQKKVSELTLIPFKETKEFLFELLSQEFIDIQPIPRGSELIPSKTFYLFNVHFLQVARNHLDNCYKVLLNLITKRNALWEENKRHLIKMKRIEQLIKQWNKQQDPNDSDVKSGQKMILEEDNEFGNQSEDRTKLSKSKSSSSLPNEIGEILTPAERDSLESLFFSSKKIDSAICHAIHALAAVKTFVECSQQK